MSHHQVKWQKGRNVVVRHKQTLFSSAMDVLVERIYVEGLIADRNVTVMSYPCVLDLASPLASSFAIDFPR